MTKLKKRKAKEYYILIEKGSLKKVISCEEITLDSLIEQYVYEGVELIKVREVLRKRK